MGRERQTGNFKFSALVILTVQRKTLEVDMRKEKSCKRKKCPHYGVEYRLCRICEWNPEGIWEVRKKV